MKDGGVEKGTAPRKIGGSNPRGATEGKAPYMPGNEKPKGKWMEVSEDYRVLDAKKAQKEKPISTRCLKKQPQMKREKNRTGISLASSLNPSLKSKKRKTKQRVSWKK